MSRRSSVTAQLSKTARRISVVIAPQLTKFEPINCLQKTTNLHIQVQDIARYQQAQQQFILHNAVLFEPIEFDILSNGEPILVGTLYPEELVVSEGGKKHFSLSFHPEESVAAIAHIKHPVSGMRVYEVRESACDASLTVSSSTDESLQWRLESEAIGLLSLLFSCGCSFSRERWVLTRMGGQLASLMPHTACFAESAMDLTFGRDIDNDTRLVALSLALLQLVRHGFPSMQHILREYQTRPH